MQFYNLLKICMKHIHDQVKMLAKEGAFKFGSVQAEFKE